VNLRLRLDHKIPRDPAVDVEADAIVDITTKNLQELRKEFNLNLTDLSMASGVSRACISYVFSSLPHHEPKLSVLVRFAKALGVPPEKFVARVLDGLDEVLR